MKCWGYNFAGQVGDGTTTMRPSPTRVSGLASVRQISAGYWYNAALRNDGTVWAWGDGGNGQLEKGQSGGEIKGRKPRFGDHFSTVCPAACSAAELPSCGGM